MKQGRTFASFDSSFEKGDYILLGIPYDETSSFRIGTHKGPEEIRKASYCFEPYIMEYAISLEQLDLHDAGDIKEIKNFQDLREKISEAISKIIGQDKFPIILGGEHSVTPPIVSSIQKNVSDLKILVLDAHLDFRDEYEGMKHSHATVSKRISETVGLENITIGGVRSISSESVEKKKPLFLTSKQVEENDCIDEILEETSRPIYLSIDMDVVDPSIAPGVGNPEPFGLSSVKMKELVSRLAPRLIGMDIVEINPEYDESNITSNLGARLIYELIGSREKKR